MGYSYVSVNTSRLSDSESDTTTIESENIADIENEFLSAKGYSKKEIELAHLIIDSVESGKDLADIKRKAVDIDDNQ
ncbi:MAG: hypothetical protein ACP5RE_03260 [Candidatus Acidifodinimicrobium sp.]